MLHREMVYDGERATRGVLLPQQQQFAPPGEAAIAPFLRVSTCRTGIKVSTPLEECFEIYRTQVQLYLACLLSTQSAWALKVSQAGMNFPYMKTSCYPSPGGQPKAFCCYPHELKGSVL